MMNHRSTSEGTPGYPENSRREPQIAGSRLAIRVRHTVGPYGARDALTVECPRQNQTVAIARCMTCPHCEQASFAGTEGGGMIRCSGEAEPWDGTGPASDSLLGAPVSTAMTTDVVCVSPDTKVETLARLFLERRISGTPVVDAAGRPIGIVSKSDLVRACWDPDPEERLELFASRGEGLTPEPWLSVNVLASADAEQLMMPVAFTVREDDPLGRAAALMAHEGIHRVPVVSRGGQVVGILSALDLVRLVAEREGYLEERRRTP